MSNGRLSYGFRSDYPVAPRLRYTFGNPSTSKLEHLQGRKWGKSRRYLLGGWHLSSYPYLPNLLMKSLTTSDYRGIGERVRIWLQKGRPGLQEYYNSTDRVFGTRDVPLSQLRHVYPYVDKPELLRLPCTIEKNKERYEAWFGTNDRRLQMDVEHAVVVKPGVLGQISDRSETSGSKDPLELHRKLVRRHHET